MFLVRLFCTTRLLRQLHGLLCLPSYATACRRFLATRLTYGGVGVVCAIVDGLHAGQQQLLLAASRLRLAARQPIGLLAGAATLRLKLTPLALRQFSLTLRKLPLTLSLVSLQLTSLPLLALAFRLLTRALLLLRLQAVTVTESLTLFTQYLEPGLRNGRASVRLSVSSFDLSCGVWRVCC